MRNIGLFISITLLLLCSCQRQQITSFDPEELRATVIEIDSINNAIIQHLDDVPTIFDQETGEPYHEQVVLDAWASVAKDWKKFVRYIRRRQFQKAALFIQNTDNQGSILGHLRESELRSIFIMDVVGNLLQEYQEDKFYSCYADWLYTEVLTEISINGISNGEPHDVSQTFPKLVVDYGVVLAAAGCLSNALELVPIFNMVNKYIDPEDELWQQLQKASFECTIYHLAGFAATGDSILLYFRDNVTPEYGARGRDAAKEVDEIIAYWGEKE